MTRRWSSSNAAAGAVNKYNTYDATSMVAQTHQEVFTVNGGSRSVSFSNSNSNNNPGSSDDSRARTSFFPTPQASARRIRPDSEDESPRSAARPAAANDTNNFVQNGEENPDENDLEVGVRW